MQNLNLYHFDYLGSSRFIFKKLIYFLQKITKIEYNKNAFFFTDIFVFVFKNNTIARKYL